MSEKPAGELVVVARDGTVIARVPRDAERVVVDAVPLHPSPTDVPKLLKGAVEALQKQAAAVDVTLTVEADAKVPRANVDAEKVAWAVTLLVGNALRYARHGSRRMPGGTIRVRVGADDASLVITVEDDGPGIPDDKCACLFERTGEVKHGSGLGLLVVHDVVTAHGGTVAVTAKCEAFTSGTTVTMRFPLDGK
jgi:signal transduction histidine kinase